MDTSSSEEDLPDGTHANVNTRSENVTSDEIRNTTTPSTGRPCTRSYLRKRKATKSTDARSPELSSVSELTTTSHSNPATTDILRQWQNPTNTCGYNVDSSDGIDLRGKVPLTNKNFNFDAILFKDLGISKDKEEQNHIHASDLISEQIQSIDPSDDEEQISHIINSLQILHTTDLSTTKTKKKTQDPLNSNRLLDHLDNIFLYSEEFKNRIRTNARNIKHYTTSINVQKERPSLSRRRAEDYKTVWNDTLKLASQIGSNLTTDMVKRFTLNDNNYNEDDLEYIKRFIGGYRYHFYHRGLDVKGFYSFNKVFTVAFHIFHSKDQYDSSLNCKFEDYLKQLSERKEETQRQQELRYRISKNLFANLYEKKSIPHTPITDEPINTLSGNDPITTGGYIVRNRDMLIDLENAYNFDAVERDPIENSYIKIGSLARICDSTCEDLSDKFIEDIISIIISFQDPNNKVLTLFAIKKYIEDTKFIDSLEKYMICYSRLRGFHRRLNEILSQLTWIKEVNRLNNDSSLNDYSKFNILLRRKLSHTANA
uniref:WAPL domain-containing protein n=1 Tax=Strongyloides papillosus TaxID=174720 RepID=A0A0N5B3W7_STREA